jgi:opacity protein-like surface antigen
MRNAARLTLVLAALLLAAAPFAGAADAVKPVGTWDAVATSPNGEMPSVITIKLVDGALKAEMELDGVPRTITDEKLEGNVFRMKVQYEGGVYDVEAKIDGDTLDGTWQGGGYSGTLKAKRRP